MKTVRLIRETIFLDFIEQIKSDGSWRAWLKKRSGILDMPRVRMHLAKVENPDNPEPKPWGGDAFKKKNWGQKHKDEFNKWAAKELRKSPLELRPHQSLAQATKTEVRNEHGELPPDLRELIGDLTDQIEFLQTELKKATDKNENLNKRIIFLKTELSSIASRQEAIADHYKSSVRNIYAYD